MISTRIAMKDWGSHKENTIMIALGTWPFRPALAGVLSSAIARSAVKALVRAISDVDNANSITP